jgi:hypothetical protein
VYTGEAVAELERAVFGKAAAKTRATKRATRRRRAAGGSPT